MPVVIKSPRDISECNHPVFVDPESFRCKALEMEDSDVICVCPDCEAIIKYTRKEWKKVVGKDA